MSLPILGRAIGHTATISWPTVWEAARGRADADRSDQRLAWWSARLLEDADVKLEVRGLERVERDRSYVVLSNHQSLYDIPVLFQALPLRLRMAAKAELFRIPIWGRAMAESGFVRIDRARGSEAREALLDAGRRLSAGGRSLWIAPEGTRGSGEGPLLPFKTGALNVAAAVGLPLLPVAIRGTAAILGRRQRRVQRGQRVTVSVLPPIEAVSSSRPLPELAEELRELIQTELARLD
ncbi:MAG TPA: lysophospholipid acyltransferase family protein [Polyangiaceae bacterium]|nr:lysophospholipid acyltransferase family protein [Polyangiaceae bacterium]